MPTYYMGISSFSTIIIFPSSSSSVLLSQPRPFLQLQRPLISKPLFQTIHKITFFTIHPPSSYTTKSYITTMALNATQLDMAEQNQSDLHPTSTKDLLIVGPGVLGKLIAQSWLKENPGCKVVGRTNTSTHHEELRSLGIIPVLKSNHPTGDCFPYVVFCAPPSGSEDYAGEVRAASAKWNGEGVFLFTSSSAVYDRSDNGPCDEDTPVVPVGKSARTDVLLRAEDVVLKAGGTVLRLAGLYTSDRGPHIYWASKGTVDARPDHILNLIHYEDAASLCTIILGKGLRGRIFMGCDNHPLSRKELMDIVNKSGKFEKFEAFTGVYGPLGKRMNNSKTQNETGWQPKYKSFAGFIEVF